MDHRKHGARLLGLLAVAVMGVMAFAASAQAVNPGFLVNKKSATGLPVAFTGAIDPGTVSSLLVPVLNFQLSCTTLAVEEGVISNATDAKAVVLYSKCTTLDLTTKAEIPCEVVEPLKAEYLILPAELTDGKPALLAEKVKALIRLTKVGDLTKPCTLPEDNVVTGDFCLKITDATNDTTEPLVEAPATCKNRSVLEGTEVTSGGVSDVLKYGGNTVTVDCKFPTEPSRPHENSTLGVSLF